MNKNVSWTILRDDAVYDTNWITVHDCDVIAPTGNQVSYGWVQYKHFAIGILPIDENGWTWLVGQNRLCFDEYTWELPEGGGKESDDPIVSAERELAEEIGMQAQHYVPILDRAQFSNSVTNEIGYAYIAHGLTPCAGEPDETEALSVRHLPLKEVYEMMNQGKLTDMFTLAMLCRAYYLANTGQLPEEISKVFRDI
ncbi:MAG: DNA mismatch repair protein MutT [Ponticaulis sp.]|nr:DNA mismatch repair protein MutT [Ponticaulis sp.]